MKSYVSLMVKMQVRYFIRVGVFVEFFNYVKGLSFEDQPNYDYMKGLFSDQLKKMKSSPKDLDWLKGGEKKGK